MKTPFRLRRLSSSAPADAFLLFAQKADALLACCVRLKTDAMPAIHRVADGFLLKLAQPTALAAPSGAIRLRRLADNLFIPADAALVPTLFDDEARGLSRERGLVFLPGGRILEYAPAQPLALASLVEAGTLRRRPWQPLPALPPRADHIRTIRLDLPDESPDVILESGKEEIGTEDPRPDDAPLPAKAAGWAALLVGRAMHALGSIFQIKGLAKKGAEWIEGALKKVPRLSETLLDKQEAILRNLLREFREGNLDRALRRALPLGGEGGRGGTPYTGLALPTHSLRYSLGSLLGGGGPPSIWFGGYDVQAELAREYRKAAEAAAKQGDYRRAAFIYGKLMQDYQSAADVLFRGGLFRDAAILYLDKLNNRRMAARAFEAAGDIDRAVELYRQMGEHILAGDVLKRAGEEAAALVEYRTAADLLAAEDKYLDAAEVMLKHAQQPELAIEYLKRGMRHFPFPHSASIPCAIRLAELYALQTAIPQLRDLTEAGVKAFATWGTAEDAGRFFNTIAHLADQPNLASIRSDLRDMALIGLAHKLRQRAAVETHVGNVVSTLLGRSGAWAASVVADADCAFKAACSSGGFRN